MNLYLKSSLALALSIVAITAFADTNPKDAYKDIQSIRATAYATARSTGKSPDFAAIDAATKAKAEEYLKGVSVDKIDAKDAWDWAKIYSAAGQHANVCALTHKFLTTNPNPEDTFEVQMLMMNSCNALNEGTMLEATLVTVKPNTSGESSQLASEAVYEYADTLQKTKGANETLKVLEQISKNLKFEDPTELAKKGLDNEKKRLTNGKQTVPPDADILKTLTARNKAMNDSIKLTLVDKESDLLSQKGQQAQAIKNIDRFIQSLDKDSQILPMAKSLRVREALPGTVPPALTVEREYGAFPGLSSLVGHVVIVDTFAHWCGPCKASFPDMVKMYDDLHAKGLDIVSVTEFYGFYNREQGLSKDAEFTRMAEFRNTYKMEWPTIFGPKSNFESLGISGIPTAYLIDRAGKVRSIHVGYSPEEFKTFRAEVEKLLTENP